MEQTDDRRDRRRGSQRAALLLLGFGRSRRLRGDIHLPMRVRIDHDVHTVTGSREREMMQEID
jgi:hypothetical protein